ncbi:leucine-rich repeat-containing protein 46 [Dipodomys spectabilis]|uniref:leucine-rich repeat-containing protein 46 n=1 Tax=Dipodomys spectabilis TaxID=105255 RepID=UPI001C538039|nr:leucine-rich repeat-containing protein 46 [Dipodomys spectabilis]
MFGANRAPSPEEEGVCITEALITKRNMNFLEDEDLSEKIFNNLAELQTVRLDREGITTIKNLEGLQNIHSLYLQENKIQRIENLACIPSLRFLSLAGNEIRQVENLLDLPYLQFLDLSENLIETLKLDELPQSLLIFNLTGNQCTEKEGYREMVLEALPLLLDLDKQPVLERWISDDEDKTSSDEDEFPELSGPFRTERGFFTELEKDMSKNQERRQKAALSEHILRMEIQPTLTDLSLLPGAPMTGDSLPSVTTEPGKEPLPEAVTSPSASSLTRKPGRLFRRGQKSSSQAETGALGASQVGPLNTTKTVTKRTNK